MAISSRTPEGRPNRCLVCGADIVIVPSDPAGDAPCPACGHLIWFDRDDHSDEQIIRLAAERLQPEALEAVLDATELLMGARVALDFSDVQDIASEAWAG